MFEGRLALQFSRESLVGSGVFELCEKIKHNRLSIYACVQGLQPMDQKVEAVSVRDAEAICSVVEPRPQAKAAAAEKHARSN